ncbi:MAG: DNA cytosine methyltransferase [Butyricicoccus sp.]
MAQVGDQKGFCASFGRGGEPFPTLLASVTAPFSFWYGVRNRTDSCVLTPLECERLMGLPENWTKYGCKNEEISDHARYRALGNSIALPCAEYVMAGIAEVMN